MTKRKVTIWLEDDVLEVVDLHAKEHKISRSAVVASYLVDALKAQAADAGIDLIVPTLQEVMRKEVGRMSDRLASLLIRTALEAATSRSLLYSEVVHRVGTEVAEQTHKAAYQASVERLKKPSRALVELLGDEHGDC